MLNFKISKSDANLIAVIIKSRARQERADIQNHGKAVFSKEEIADMDRIGDLFNQENKA